MTNGNANANRAGTCHFDCHWCSSGDWVCEEEKDEIVDLFVLSFDSLKRLSSHSNNQSTNQPILRFFP
jgi:hypothetical protein